MRTTQLPEYHPFKSAEARARYLAHYDAQSDAWPLESDVMMVEAPQGTTRLRVHGDPGLPPLFLFNGALCNSLIWSPAMIAKLTETHRTYSLDNLYDFGRSVPARPGGGADDYNAWLDGLLEALGLQDGVNLFGISRGAWIIAEYLLHAPARVAKAVWLSPAMVVQQASWRNALDAPKTLGAFVNPSHKTVASMTRALMPEMERDNKEYFDRFVDEMALGLQCFANVKGAALGPRVFSDEELAGIRVPVLYMAGEQERLCSVPSAVRRLARVAPQIETAIFPGVGHDLIDAQMEPMTDRMLRFLLA